jgi:hypothetical protein
MPQSHDRSAAAESADRGDPQESLQGPVLPSNGIDCRATEGVGFPMITMNGASLQATLIESLTNDLCELADIVAEFADPENAEAARAAVRAWSPSRMARAMAEEMVAG